MTKTKEAKEYKYTPNLKILNTENLPRGTGAKFLECVFAPDNVTSIAKQWRHIKPSRYAALVKF